MFRSFCLGPQRLIVAGLFLLAAGLGIALWLFDPAQTIWMPKCVFKLATGLDCPGCGATRAAHALAHGHLREALAYNYFLVIGLAYAAAASTAIYLGKFRNKKIKHFILGKPMAYTYIALFFAWWILRNIPSFKQLL